MSLEKTVRNINGTFDSGNLWDQVCVDFFSHKFLQ